MTERPTLNIEAAAERIGVSRRTIYYWIKSGKLEVKTFENHAPRVYVDSLLAQKKRSHD